MQSAVARELVRVSVTSQMREAPLGLVSFNSGMFENISPKRAISESYRRERRKTNNETGGCLCQAATRCFVSGDFSDAVVRGAFLPLAVPSRPFTERMANQRT